VLYALNRPASLVGLLLAFVVGITAYGLIQAVLAARFGDRVARAEGRARPDPRAHVDPFGAIAAAVAGIGWGRQVPLDPRRLGGRGRAVGVLLSGPLALAVLSVLGLLAYLGLGGSRSLLALVSAHQLLQGFDGPAAAPTVALAFAVGTLFLALLALVPLPPLDGWRLLRLLTRPSPGLDRAHHYLAEQNFGIAVLLLLLLLPLAGRSPLLPFLLDLVASPLVHLAGRGG